MTMVSTGRSGADAAACAGAEEIHRMWISGAVDPKRLDGLEDVCTFILSRRRVRLILDFAGMTDCPSALFLRLSAMSRRARAESGSLEVVGLGEALRRIIGA
jgi:hypothetical protein